MLISHLHVQNYRALQDVSIPLSKFVCLIGENNSGKSSIIQALSLFLTGTTLSQNSFFDPSKDVRIEVTFSQISADDLARLGPAHQTRIEQILVDTTLVLVRIYGPEGKSVLRYRIPRPKDPRFSAYEIDELVKGKKPGKDFMAAIAATFPELANSITAATNLTQARDLIDELAASLPEKEKVLQDVNLPTGFDKSIQPLFPERIYIPAVKDLADDIKTKESTPFGKVLGILLAAIEPKLATATELFEELSRKLNRTVLDDGTERDERLEEVKLIESTIERIVQESFAAVRLRISIPPPEIKTVLANARITVDDGVEGLVDSKGDGLKRAIVFAILRSYVQLAGSLTPLESLEGTIRPSYLLLFEEPELYLHPKAQNILFDALSAFSRTHHVLVTTHSPAFFGPEATATFVKLSKVSDPAVAARPFSRAHPVDLTELSAKDQFQVICYENNNNAFFARTVVLVEGISDQMAFSHVSRTLNPAWDVMRDSVSFAVVNGKSSLGRYRDFFRRFDIRVVILADLDVLVDGWEKLGVPESLDEIRTKLVVMVDEAVAAKQGQLQVTNSQLHAARKSRDLRACWRAVQDAKTAWDGGKGKYETLSEAVGQFFKWERRDLQLEVLRECNGDPIATLKARLLAELRHNNVLILSRGALEDYYPETIQRTDKTLMAREFCQLMDAREKVLALCTGDHGGAEVTSEFDVICRHIFAPDTTPVLVSAGGQGG